jgi:hypothetical protein
MNMHEIFVARRQATNNQSYIKDQINTLEHIQHILREPQGSPFGVFVGSMVLIFSVFCVVVMCLVSYVACLWGILGDPFQFSVWLLFLFLLCVLCPMLPVSGILGEGITKNARQAT